MSKHIAVREEAGLLNVSKVGRTNIHYLDTARLPAHTAPREAGRVPAG